MFETDLATWRLRLKNQGSSGTETDVVDRNSRRLRLKNQGSSGTKSANVVVVGCN